MCFQHKCTTMAGLVAEEGSGGGKGQAGIQRADVHQSPVSGSHMHLLNLRNMSSPRSRLSSGEIIFFLLYSFVSLTPHSSRPAFSFLRYTELFYCHTGKIQNCQHNCDLNQHSPYHHQQCGAGVLVILMPKIPQI